VKSYTTERFRKLFAQLPLSVRKQAREAYKFFKDDPNHPGLHFKKVHPTRTIYSARVNADYRVVGILDDDEIVWFWIGPHTEYDKLLSRL
jgi:mRNA-degrading endonuclease RelE of RelBE toxin-antitoxin system